MCKGKKENIVKIVELSSLLNTWDSLLAIKSVQTTHKMILLQTPICGACGVQVQIVHANFETQQSKHQNKKQVSCVVL